MKRAISGLIVVTALMASSAFASDKDLCDVNLQKVKDLLATQQDLGEPAKGNANTFYQTAISNKAAGKDKECISQAQQAVQVLQNAGKSQN
ncbi:hypothetical protein [Pseudomonas sp. nanlin1]|uniref:hypothetical protein n=1 Tax=Pseudomonas sp. nanlin1 TaxID=3040605 RepID=UPI00388CFC05